MDINTLADLDNPAPGPGGRAARQRRRRNRKGKRKAKMNELKNKLKLKKAKRRGCGNKSGRSKKIKCGKTTTRFKGGNKIGGMFELGGPERLY